MSTESTALEALVAEMLGDIGKLHKSVESLKLEIPEQIGDAQERIAAMFTHIEVATGVHADTAKTISDAANRIATMLSNPVIEKGVKLSIIQASEDATKRINAAAENAVKGVLNAELAGLNKTINKASNQLSSTRTELRKWLLSIAVLSGLTGGIGALLIGKYLHLI